MKYLLGIIKIYYLRNIKNHFLKWNILRSGVRKCFEYRYLPYFYFRKEFQRILFVGVSACTEHYGEYFSNKKSVSSIDLDKERTKFGIKDRHIIDSIENIDKYFAENSLDAVLMNGVYGWGLDSEEALIKSLQNIHKVLRPGGVLLFGWDKVPKHDPIDLDSKPYFKNFKKYEILGRSRLELDNKHHHIFDIYQKP